MNRKVELSDNEKKAWYMELLNRAKYREASYLALAEHEGVEAEHYTAILRNLENPTGVKP